MEWLHEAAAETYLPCCGSLANWSKMVWPEGKRESLLFCWRSFRHPVFKTNSQIPAAQITGST